MRQLILTEGGYFVGNGRVVMGGEGADILRVFASCYSIPDVMRLKLTHPDVNFTLNCLRAVRTEYYRSGKPGRSSCPYKPRERGMNFVMI